MNELIIIVIFFKNELFQSCKSNRKFNKISFLYTYVEKNISHTEMNATLYVRKDASEIELDIVFRLVYSTYSFKS